jgi:hypothetical protein
MGKIRKFHRKNIPLHAKDMSGQTFNRLTVISRAANVGKHPHWLCRCVCGKETVVNGYNLRIGHTTSCGCRQKEVAAYTAVVMGINNSIAGIEHGHARGGTRTPTYESWHSALQRCYNPNDKKYKYYGGAIQPVQICDRWRHSFESFLSDLGERPEGCTLGRLMDVGNYEPGNCRWMTWAEQAQEAKKKRDAQKLI